KVLQSFPGVKTLADLKALEASQLLGDILRRKLSDPTLKDAAAKTRIDVYGHVGDGNETAHVIYRSRTNSGEMELVRLNVATLQKAGQDWKMVIPEEIAGPMKKGGALNPAMLNATAARVEPLGHLLAGKGLAFILYRYTLPAGDSPISKLAVMELSARDPAFESVRQDKLDQVKTLLEERLGIRTAARPDRNIPDQKP